MNESPKQHLRTHGKYHFMRVFLDFDGVLHPVGGSTLPFEHLPSFEEFLRKHPEVQVVISSSWRETFGVDYIRETFFSFDVQQQIIGGTPSLPNCYRYDEVQTHIEQSGYKGDFIVIDDDAGQFPPAWPPLLLCNPSEGLTHEKLKELLHRIRGNLK